MFRRTLAVLIALTTSAAFISAASASASPTKPSGKHTNTKLFESNSKHPLAHFRHTAVGNAPLDVPPGGGCWGETGFGTTAEYDGTTNVLLSTETPYSGTVLCDVSDPSQTMSWLQADAALFINGSKREPDASPESCQHMSSVEPLCVNVASNERVFCFAISEACSGTYQSANQFDMLLPDGWTWDSVAPKCHEISPQELSYLVYSSEVDSPEFYTGS